MQLLALFTAAVKIMYINYVYIYIYMYINLCVAVTLKNGVSLLEAYFLSVLEPVNYYSIISPAMLSRI